jgi:hypothetical protein
MSLRQIVGMFTKFKWDKKNNEEIIDTEYLDREVNRAKKIGIETYLKEKNETITSLIRKLNKTGCYASPITEIIVMEG